MSPRPRQATGRPGTPVIPTGWATAHATVVEGTLRGVVELRHPGTQQAWSDTADGMVAVPLDPYATAVPARILELTGEARVVHAGEDTELIVDFLVVIPAAQAGLAERDLVTVTSSGDLLLDGRVLQVERVLRGTERFERDLLCTLYN